MTEEPTVPRWYDKVIEYMAKRERRAVLRMRLKAARDAGLAERHRRRLERIKQREQR